MAIRSKDIYKGRKKSKGRGWKIALVIVAVLLVLIGIFYGLRGLCVYDAEGNAVIYWPWEQRPAATPTTSVTVTPAGAGAAIPGAAVTPDGAASPSDTPADTAPAATDTPQTPDSPAVTDTAGTPPAAAQ